MRSVNTIVIDTLSEHAHSVQSTMHMIVTLFEELKSVGLDVSYERKGSIITDIQITDPHEHNAVLCTDPMVSAIDNGADLLVTKLARLLELKIVEKRINDCYLEALYLGWRLSIKGIKVDTGLDKKSCDHLQVWMHDGEHGVVSYPLTYEGISQFEEDLFAARLRRDVVVNLTTYVTSGDVHLTSDGFCCGGARYGLTRHDIDRAKRDHSQTLAKFMQTKADKAIDDLVDL